MEITETLHIKTREEFRSWLERNHGSKKEIWLVYHKKHTGKPRIPYDDAVEEAICFGWIDSTVKRMDEEKYCQRYTPRNYKSVWSETNTVRLRKMLDAGLMTGAGLAKVPPEVMKLAKSGVIMKKGPVVPKELDEPPDLTSALESNQTALINWKRFAPSHRRMYIYWITDAKKPETRERRVARVVEHAKVNRKTMI